MIKMNFVVFYLTLMIAVVVSGGPAWKDTNIQRAGGLKVGHERNRTVTTSRGNGLKLGTGNRASRMTTTAAPEDTVHTPSITTLTNEISQLHVGMVVPHKAFGVREYNKAISSAKYNLQRKLVELWKTYDLQIRFVMKELTPSPTGKLVVLIFLNIKHSVLCHEQNKLTKKQITNENLLLLRFKINSSSEL